MTDHGHTSDVWDSNAPMYTERTEHLTSQFVEALLDLVGVGSHDDLLDVACGTGAVSLAAAGRGARVTAVDYSPKMLEIFRERLGSHDDQHHRIETREGDAQKLPWSDDTFSAAVSSFGIIFCPDVPQAIREMRRVVRPGGRVGLTAWTRPSDNTWTALLPDDAADRLGFELPDIPMFRWASADEMAAELGEMGLDDVVIEQRSGVGARVADSSLLRALIVHAPTQKANLVGLDEPQREQIADLVVSVVDARLAAGEDAVGLPGEAWIAAGTVA